MIGNALVPSETVTENSFTPDTSVDQFLSPSETVFPEMSEVVLLTTLLVEAILPSLETSAGNILLPLTTAIIRSDVSPNQTPSPSSVIANSIFILSSSCSFIDEAFSTSESMEMVSPSRTVQEELTFSPRALTSATSSEEVLSSPTLFAEDMFNVSVSLTPVTSIRVVSELRTSVALVSPPAHVSSEFVATPLLLTPSASESLQIFGSPTPSSETVEVICPQHSGVSIDLQLLKAHYTFIDYIEYVSMLY